MMKLVREIPLENGLTVCIYNHNHRYFGDYHRVRVEIVCKVKVLEEYFADRAEYEEAKISLGDSAVFRHNVELMGVSSGELDRSLERVIKNYANHSLAYLASPIFPRKLVLAEFSGSRQKNARHIQADE
ncbi:MAG TPA: hypothetical protein VHN12_01180 [Geobacteraceae bacterium]|nr:hypothetical protein [Geobacteraceae bacterium]